MESIKVLVVDDNVSFVNIIKKYFSDHAFINICLEAYDGKEAIRLIRDFQSDYDLVVLDLVMPYKDGLDVLLEMKESGINKKVIVISSCGSDEMIRKVSEYNISFFMLKPFDICDLEKRICYCFENNKRIDNDLQISITKVLHELGIPSHINGYQYIMEGLLLMSIKHNNVKIKSLYDDIASIYNTTSTCVERSMRHAIEVSWNRGNWDLIEEIFGHSIDIDKAKPTNREFIITVSNKLKMDFKII